MENSKSISPKETEEQRQSERASIKEQRQNTVDSSFKELLLEMRFQRRFFAYFGRQLREPKIAELSVVEDRLEEALTYEEFCDLFPYDLVVSGKLRHVADSPDIFLIVEIAFEVNLTEVSRAVHRVNLLRKAGIHAVPVVAGEEVTQDADKAIREQNVVLWQNEHLLFWKEAVANWVDIDIVT